MKPPVAILIKHFSGLLCLLLIIGMPTSTVAAEDKSSQLKQLQSEINTLTRQVTKTRGERDEERKKLRDIEKRIAALHLQLRATQRQNKALQQQLKCLKKKQEEHYYATKKQHHSHLQDQMYLNMTQALTLLLLTRITLAANLGLHLIIFVTHPKNRIGYEAHSI